MRNESIYRNDGIEVIGSGSLQGALVLGARGYALHRQTRRSNSAIDLVRLFMISFGGSWNTNFSYMNRLSELQLQDITMRTWILGRAECVAVRWCRALYTLWERL